MDAHLAHAAALCGAIPLEISRLNNLELATSNTKNIIAQPHKDTAAGTRADITGSRHDSIGEDSLAPTSPVSENGTKDEAATRVAEDVLGQGGDMHYKTCGWLQCAWILIAETISLGVLTLPSAIARLGLVPGNILIIFLGLAATYSGYVIYQFRMRYPHIINMADAGGALFGPIGREVFGALSVLGLIFGMAAHILTFTIAMNEITGHATCQIVWGMVAAVVSFFMTLPRTLRGVSNFSFFSFVSITTAVLITMIYLGVHRTGDETVHGFVPRGATTLPQALVAVLDITIAYAGHVAFPTFIAELRQPRDFPKSLVLLQTTAITFYTLTSSLIYYFAGATLAAGPDASPALRLTSPLVKKIAFGVAMPTILIAGVIGGHTAAKYVFVRVWQRFDRRVITQRRGRALVSWVGMCGALWTVAWVVSQSVPGFNEMLALFGALLVAWFTYGISGMFWLRMNKGQYWRTWRKACLTVVNVGIIVMAAALTGLGLYGSIKLIGGGMAGKSFSC